MFHIDYHSHEPLYRQLKRQILNRIGRPGWVPNQTAPSIRKLAKETGLSYVTVARAVSELIQEGILVKARGRGTLVAELPRDRSRAGVIGITGRFMERTLFSDPCYSELMQGVEPVLHTRNHPCLFRIWQGSLQDTFDEIAVSGILVFGYCLHSDSQVMEIVESRVPVIVVTESVRHPDVNYVDSDNLHDSTDIVERMIRAGRKRIAVISGESLSNSPKLRYQGYQLALAQHGMAFDSKLVVSTNQNKEIMEVLRRIKPDALFDTQHSAFQVASEWLKRGVRIPEDVMIATYDDYGDRLGELDVSYMIVKQPFKEIGCRAAELLMNLMAGRIQGSIRLNLKSQVLERGRNAVPSP